MRLKRKTAGQVGPAVGIKSDNSFIFLYNNELSRHHNNLQGGVRNLD